MKKCIVGLVAVLLAGVFALPGVASAQNANDVTVEGRGWLAAKGTGDVDIDMGGQLRMKAEGDVTITDNSGDMRVRLKGRDGGDEERSANVSLSDFRGKINVRGTDFTVTVDGQVVLQARGRGEATLIGDGYYRTRNGERTVWDGLVRIGDPQAQAAG